MPLRNISWRIDHELELEGFGDIVRRANSSRQGNIIGRGRDDLRLCMLEKKLCGGGKGEDRTMKCSSCQGEEDSSHAESGWVRRDRIIKSLKN